jgi:hypothetical protein
MRTFNLILLSLLFSTATLTGTVKTPVVHFSYLSPTHLEILHTVEMGPYTRILFA